MNKKREQFKKICEDIKEIKIQGARNIAKAGLKAYKLFPTDNSIDKLISLRKTEPMLANTLRKAKKLTPKKILPHFEEAQDEINKLVYNLIEKGDTIYTHCHSTNVTHALIYAHKKGKKFEVYNTETRPLYQGRKTAKELKDAGIKVTMFIDSAMDIALSKKQKTKKVNKIMIGADALLRKSVINKVGSGMIAKLARVNKIPLYIIADSWKYSGRQVEIEERDFYEVWKNLPKNSKIKIRNPAFERVKRKFIAGIVTELGLMKYKRFLQVIKKRKY